MFTEIEKIINNTINRALEESVCDFKNWWKDDFETDVYFVTEEEFKALDEDDLETAKADWIYWVVDGFTVSVCVELGINTDGNTYSNGRLVEEIWEIIREKLREAIS